MADKYGDFTQTTPPADFPESARWAIFEHIFRRLASHRNKAQLYAETEYILSSRPEQEKIDIRDMHVSEINRWAQELLSHTWAACQEPGGGGH